MTQKTYVPEGEAAPASQVGATLEALAATIAARRDAGDESYTHRLLAGSPDAVLKKVMEEAGEVALAAKDVESWATSSLAAAMGFDAARGADPDEMDVQLPPEYGQAIDHLRYEAADVVYHLLVVLERYGIGLDEFAAELNNRMTERERPTGAVRLHDEYVRRGK
ncbi:MAG: phosphoribosyl-ATP diphosphatase [Eggerthellaceae bacterium]|nr:phosphoribosyl-ATP diphosphatase [Eggerthellaceae bacterium]